MQPLTKNSFRLMRKPALGSMDFVKCSEDLKNELNTSRHALFSLVVTQCSLGMPHSVTYEFPCSISKPRPQPWVTQSLQNLLQKRISLHRKVRKHPNDGQLLQSYRYCRREGTLLNKSLKTPHSFHLFKTHR